MGSGVFITEAANNLVKSLMSNKEDLLRDALNHVIGHKDWSLGDILCLAEFKILPDGTEIFCYDGVDLIQFMLPESWVEKTEESTKIMAGQKYRLLYAMSPEAI